MVNGRFLPCETKENNPQKKTDRKNNRIVVPMWPGILLDLPLFYLTCPVGPTPLGKTVMLVLLMQWIRTTAFRNQMYYGLQLVLYVRSGRLVTLTAPGL